MATLATDKQRPYELGDLNSLPMVATDIIYEGAAVGIEAASGNARPLNAGDAFAGFCIQNADNATGSAGDVRVQVKTHGEVQLPVANVAATDIGKPVYASDDDTFVLTATGNSYIGMVKRFVSTGVAVVAFDVRRGGLLAPLEVQLPVANVAATDIGKLVYASDDDTFVLTATGNSYIGKVKRFVSTGVAVVAFDVRRGRLVAPLTDSTTGTADGTLADVGAAFDQATLNNNFADLAAKINALAAQLK